MTEVGAKAGVGAKAWVNVGANVSGRARLVLASASPSRAHLLEAAGLAFAVVPADIDEHVVREVLAGGQEGALDECLPPADVAEVLARSKAERVSAGMVGASQAPEPLVIGADQVLAFEGEIFEKPRDLGEARECLLRLRGRTHELVSAVAVARGGSVFWSHIASARMSMRDFSPTFLGDYLASAGKGVLTSIGAYRVEEMGIQLFARIEGEHSTILGLPLLPLLECLRREGVLPS